MRSVQAPTEPTDVRADAIRPLQRLPALDGLRALAALAVMFDHGLPGWDLLRPASRLAMDVFFAMSGFLVGGLALDARNQPGWIWRFWVRRACRIWPLYFASCLALTFMDSRNPYPLPTPNWMLWSFLENFAIIRAHRTTWLPISVLWSISVEEQFYLLLPLLLSLCRTQRAVLSACLCVAAASIMLRLTGHLSLTEMYISTFARLDALSFGVIAAQLHRSGNRRAFEAANWVAAVALLFAVLEFPVSPWVHKDWRSVLFGQTLGSLGTAALCLALANGRAALATRLLAFRPLAFVGTISFGVYLISPYLILPTYGLWPAIPATLILAWLSHRFFEEPIRRWGTVLVALRKPRGIRAFTQASG